jgi:hypothetical protein
VVSKGPTQISHARNTLIHALGGAEVGFADEVHAFNTDPRKASHGYMANIVMAPLFRTGPTQAR